MASARNSVSPTTDYKFLTQAQLEKEIEKCLNCEDKPCMRGCPAKCSPADFIMAAKMQKPSDFARSAMEIYSMNPLGGVCGVCCPDKFCMKKCSRKNIDEPVNIPAIQATVIQRAHELGVVPTFNVAEPKPNTKENKIAIVGAGPAGLSCAAILGSRGYHVTIFERRDKAMGDATYIPKYRMPAGMLENDLKFIQSCGDIQIKYRTNVEDSSELLNRFGAVAVATGVGKDNTMQFAGHDAAMTARVVLDDVPKHAPALGSNVAVIGGGAVAVDVACSLKKQGADHVTIFYRRGINEMPVDQWERDEIRKFGVDVVGRTVPKEVFAIDGRVKGIRTVRVEMPHRSTGMTEAVEVSGSEQVWPEITGVVFAIGMSREGAPSTTPGVFSCGDFVNGASTVVEAVASGKKIAHEIDMFLAHVTIYEISVNGIPKYPVDLTTDFYGFKMVNPFLLSAAPNTDGLDNMRLALKAGWAGGVMKTCFDGLPIHIPNEYMKQFGPTTYGNADNVSGHTLDREIEEIKILRKEFPDRLIIGATGGPVSGNLEHDKAGWQHNTLKLETSGCHGIEYSLSCPQGGDGSEGAIASQSVKMTQRIVDWVMEVSDPNVPKFFKMSAAVTSISVIVNAVKEILNKYPGKKAGVTLANSFPSLGFRKRTAGKGVWEEGVVYGMAGKGVLPISYLSLATVINLGVDVSGNGGVYDYESAANFLALGAKNVQICTLAMVEGVGIIDDLCIGLSYYLKYVVVLHNVMYRSKNIKSIDQLIGITRPNPISDFMELTGVKKISSIDASQCCQYVDDDGLLIISCGNCMRCPYLAITLSQDKKSLLIDPSMCVGCGMCTLKCPSRCMTMRDRTPEEAKVTPH